MKKNKKYLKAAELLISKKDEYNFPIGCCNVLTYEGQCASNFHDIFKPEDSLINDWYFGPGGNEKAILARTLALILMYEMGEL